MAESPLITAHRSIRSIAPPDVPVPGVLTTYDGETVLCVPLEELDNYFWDCEATEHVWAPLDLIAHAHGASAVLPWCSQPVTALLAARRGEPLHGGEAVTLVVSILRGVREAEGAWGMAEVVTGTWWVTDNGRPLFVRGDGLPLRQATSACLATVGTACADAMVGAAAARVCDVMNTPGPIGDTADMERALFDLAAPRPVAPVDSGASEALRPKSAASRMTYSGERDDAGTTGARWSSVLRAAARWWESRRPVLLATKHHRGGGIAPRPNDQAEKVRGDGADGTKKGSARRRIVVMGVITAVVVLGVAASIVLDDGSEEKDGRAAVPADTAVGRGSVPPPDVPSPASSSEATAPAAAAEPAPSAPQTSDDDPVRAAEALLAQAAACVREGDPCDGVVASPDLLEALPAEAPLRLIDDYGGMAVVGVGDPPVPVLLERLGEAWRIRDIPTAAANS